MSSIQISHFLVQNAVHKYDNQLMEQLSGIQNLVSFSGRKMNKGGDSIYLGSQIQILNNEMSSGIRERGKGSEYQTRLSFRVPLYFLYVFL